MTIERLDRTFALAYECLRRKINGGRIQVANEASLQLQFAAILKSVGELLEAERSEFFSIELEKPVYSANDVFGKSGSKNAKIDILFSFTNAETKEVHRCAVEMKYFQRKNHREPNNRYDVFADIKNLENYGDFAEKCYLLVATDHNHYVDHAAYKAATAAFDFRDGRSYVSGTKAEYRTEKGYGDPITLQGSYDFKWDATAGGLHFLQLAIDPQFNAARLSDVPSHKA